MSNPIVKHPKQILEEIQQLHDHVRECMIKMQGSSREVEANLNAQLDELEALLSKREQELAEMRKLNDEKNGVIQRLQFELSARPQRKSSGMRRSSDYDFTGMEIKKEGQYRVKVVERFNNKQWSCQCLLCGNKIVYTDAYLRRLQVANNDIVGCRNCGPAYGKDALSSKLQEIENDNN